MSAPKNNLRINLQTAATHIGMPLLVVLLLPLIWLTGCAEKIDLELDETYSRLVVEASVSNRMDMHRVVLTRTANFFSTDAAPRVEGASVSISDGKSRWELTERDAGMYLPAAKFFAEAGQAYHLADTA
jgi:hypothetical protein